MSVIPVLDKKLHGFSVKAAYKLNDPIKEEHGERSVYVLLIDRGTAYIGKQRYVTCRYVDGWAEWNSGNYKEDLKAALEDFYERCKQNESFLSFRSV